MIETFHRDKADSRPAAKQAIVGMICTSLLVHARIEEEIFYPAMRAAGSPQYDLTFMELMRDVLHHVADESRSC